MATMNRDDRELLHRKYQRAEQLLLVYMPYLHPSALKHEYVTSTSNVLRNLLLDKNGRLRRNEDKPIIREHVPRPEGGEFTCVMGFGDIERTLPLTLMIDERGRVFHSFLPNVNNPVEMGMLKQLQTQDDIFVARVNEARRKNNLPLVQNRPIINELTNAKKTYGGTDRLNETGITAYSPPIFNDKAVQRRLNEGWFDTLPIDPDDTIRHQGRPDMGSTWIGSDREIIDRNVFRSTALAESRGGAIKPSLRITLSEDDIDTRLTPKRVVEDPTLSF